MKGERTDDARRVLAELGSAWRIGDRSAGRLQLDVQGALNSGWAVSDLVAELGKGAEGVRSPYAVLTARLRDLPEAPHCRPRCPAWCGECHEPTRMREAPDGAPYRCPTCHPGRTREAQTA